MSNPAATVEYVVRVQLPPSYAYHSGPSGDTEYEEDYNKAIFAAKPEGFEVAWPSKDTWPKDKDGMTWVRLYCTDHTKAMEYFRDRAESLQRQVDRMRAIGRELANG